MKFYDLYKEVAKEYLTEQEMSELENQENELNVPQQPLENQEEPVENQIESELPTEETIDLNEEKYKALLLMIQKALIDSSKEDIDKRNRLADIQQKIETNPKEAENLLKIELGDLGSEFPKSSDI
jgi:hypothetical protein